MTPPLYEACQQAAHVITAEGRVIKAGRAAMFILEEIGPHLQPPHKGQFHIGGFDRVKP